MRTWSVCGSNSMSTRQLLKEHAMTSGKDLSSSTKRGTSQGKKNANCSFCRKSYRDVGPLVEGPG